MKTARKVLLLILCAALLVSATVMGTMAYLADTTKEVKNTFTVGNVKLGDDLKGGLDEALVNKDGEPIKSATDQTVVDLDKAPRVQENVYKLVPGHTYTKDPTVHVNSSSEDCYLFVKVSNGISEIEATTNTIASQMAAKGWKAVDGQDGVYIYAYSEDGNAIKTIVKGGEDKVVFGSFTLKTDAKVSDYEKAEITIMAYAIQADGFADSTPAQIWTALSGQLNPAA